MTNLERFYNGDEFYLPGKIVALFVPISGIQGIKGHIEVDGGQLMYVPNENEYNRVYEEKQVFCLIEGNGFNSRLVIDPNKLKFVITKKQSPNVR